MGPSGVLFVDRTGLIAVLDRGEPGHMMARVLWEMACDEASELVTTNYAALLAAIEIQARHGLEGVRILCEQILPAMHVEWCRPSDHALATAALLARDDGADDLGRLVDEKVRLRLRIAHTLDPA